MEGLHRGLERRGAGPGPIDALAKAGNPLALDLLEVWAEHLGLFLADRVERLARRGVSIERVVIGARSGGLLADGELGPRLRLAVESAAAGRQAEPMLPGFLVPSTGRAAPAIGVAAEALGRVERP
jgi:predicted NBD/HSP70 family sugar kinase